MFELEAVKIRGKLAPVDLDPEKVGTLDISEAIKVILEITNSDISLHIYRDLTLKFKDNELVIYIGEMHGTGKVFQLMGELLKLRDENAILRNEVPERTE